jgi:hypothetical protein
MNVRNAVCKRSIRRIGRVAGMGRDPRFPEVVPAPVAALHLSHLCSSHRTGIKLEADCGKSFSSKLVSPYGLVK